MEDSEFWYSSTQALALWMLLLSPLTYAFKVDNFFNTRARCSSASLGRPFKHSKWARRTKDRSPLIFLASDSMKERFLTASWRVLGWKKGNLHHLLSHILCGSKWEQQRLHIEFPSFWLLSSGRLSPRLSVHFCNMQMPSKIDRQDH